MRSERPGRPAGGPEFVADVIEWGRKTAGKDVL
jgi:hypothetical protein